MTALFSVACSGCKRAFQLSADVLERRRKCNICGAALILPPDADAEVKKVAHTRVLSGGPAVIYPQKISKECPVCVRVMWIEKPAPEKRVNCSYCGSILAVQADLSVAIFRDPAVQPALTQSYVGSMACPSCSARRLKETDGLGLRARCEACSADVELSTRPLTDFLPEIAGTSGILDLVAMATDQRWTKGDIGLAEAAYLRGLAAKLDHWAADETLSPFEPDVTAQIVQFVSLGMSMAVTERNDDVMTIVMPLDGKTSPDGAMVLKSAVKYGMMAGGASRYSLPGLAARHEMNKSEAIVGHASLLVDIVPASKGSDINLRKRESTGEVSRVSSEEKARFKDRIAQSFVESAQRYLALKAIFGIWLRGAAIQALTAKSITNRMQALGGVLAENADQWAEGLMPPSA
jgi:hypothetical protein